MNKKIGNYKYYLLSNLRKPEKFKDIANNDHAFLHLKHIRNAIAHGNVTSINRSNFGIKDYSEQGNLSAKGKLKSELLSINRGVIKNKKVILNLWDDTIIQTKMTL